MCIFIKQISWFVRRKAFLYFIIANNLHLQNIVINLQHQNKEAVESIENIKNAGLKVTPQRKAVYEAMMELRHATIDEIIKYVQSKDSEITVSTIYRILDSFCKASLLSLVFHPEMGKSYYDITVTEHHHIFEGQQIMDYMDDGLTELIRQYLKDNIFASVDINKIQVQISVNNQKSNSKN